MLTIGTPLLLYFISMFYSLFSNYKRYKLFQIIDNAIPYNMKPIVIRYRSHSSLDGNFESFLSFKDVNETIEASNNKHINSNKNLSRKDNINPIHNDEKNGSTEESICNDKKNSSIEESLSTISPKEYIIFNQSSFIVNISSFTSIVVTIGMFYL